MNDWNLLTDEEQVYLFWEFQNSNPDFDDMTFQEVDEMMRGTR